MWREPVTAHQRVDARTLPAEIQERLRARAAQAGAARAGLGSEQLGCVAVLGLAGAAGLVAGVSRISSVGFDWVAVALPVLGLIFIAVAGAMLMARKTSPIPEFTLTTHAYHLVSPGDGSLDAYCMPLCSEVRFTTVLLNGLYNQTELSARFGDQTVVLTDVLQGEARDRPWAGSERFRAFLSMMESAAADLAAGRWAQVSGADLFPGTPSAPTLPPSEALRRPPESRAR